MVDIPGSIGFHFLSHHVATKPNECILQGMKQTFQFQALAWFSRIFATAKAEFLLVSKERDQNLIIIGAGPLNDQCEAFN